MKLHFSWFHALAAMSAVVYVVALSSAHTAARTALKGQDGQRSGSSDVSRTASAGVYSADQATRGQSEYVAECGRCHGEPLSGTEFGPALIGNTFVDDWDGTSVGDLFERIQTTMPQDSPGRLAPRLTADIVAYILKSNEFPPGQTTLEPDQAVLKTIKIDAKHPAGHH
jgi:mono/diheme cytochrome c family protein